MSEQKDTDAPSNIQNYKKYRNILKLSDLLDEYAKADCLPIHCAIKRNEKHAVYFHHFIIVLITTLKDNDTVEIKINHKAGADFLSNTLFSAVGLGTEFSKIREDTIIISGNKIKNDKGKLINFKNGRLYVLGDYTPTQRKDAAIRANEKRNKRDFYSLESANCEHYVNFCFLGEGKSYQSELKKRRTAQGDAAIDVVSNTTKDLLKNGVTVGIEQAGEAIVEALATSTKEVIKNRGFFGLIKKTVKESTITSFGMFFNIYFKF
jgi:hypothetical protein